MFVIILISYILYWTSGIQWFQIVDTWFLSYPILPTPTIDGMDLLFKNTSASLSCRPWVTWLSSSHGKTRRRSSSSTTSPASWKLMTVRHKYQRGSFDAVGDEKTCAVAHSIGWKREILGVCWTSQPFSSWQRPWNRYLIRGLPFLDIVTTALSAQCFTLLPVKNDRPLWRDLNPLLLLGSTT